MPILFYMQIRFYDQKTFRPLDIISRNSEVSPTIHFKGTYFEKCDQAFPWLVPVWSGNQCLLDCNREVVSEHHDSSVDPAKRVLVVSHMPDVTSKLRFLDVRLMEGLQGVIR